MREGLLAVACFGNNAQQRVQGRALCTRWLRACDCLKSMSWPRPRLPRYRGQFVKLLSSLQRDFLPELRRAAGDDVAALATLLDSYVADGLFRKPPEGRNMPQVDISQMRENRA